MTKINYDESLDYKALNALSSMLNEDGELQLDADQEAVKRYMETEIKERTMHFETPLERIHWLLENNYYSKDTFGKYSDEFLTKIYNFADSLGHTFPSFMGAYKFYMSYALKTNDGKTYLETFSERAVAVALHLAGGDEEDALHWAEEIITGRYQPATPTFLNSGKVAAGGLVSCFILHPSDNMESIARMVTDSLQLSKRGGGVGINLSNIREEGSPIKGVEGQSSGLVPVMKILDDSFRYANQLGARQGAGVAYIHACHPDVYRAMDTKRENADEATRIKTLSLGLIIPDIVMELAKKNEKLYHFSVYDVEREYGCEYSDVDFTAEYYNMLNNPRIRKSQEKETFPARKLFATIAEIQFESGYPYILFIDHANRAHKAAGKIKASNLCVTGETEILTGDGYRKVRELYDSQEDFQVVVDERARLMDLSQSGTSVQESTKMFKTAENAQIFKLETREGYSLRATPWHKMYVVREGEVVKIPLSDVIPGDKILVQGNKSNSFGETHMPDEAYICGVMASDGTFGSNRDKEKDVAKIDLWYDKSEFADRITRAIHNVLDGRLDLIHGHSGTLTPHFREAAGGKKVSLSSSALGRALKELGFTHKTKLQIPEFIKNSDKETQESYICGLFQLDGTITGSEKNGSISIEIGSVNKELLKDLQILLLTHGVYTRIYLTKNAGMESLPDGRGGLKEYPTKNVYSLRTRDRLSRERLHDIVVWRKEREEYWKKRCESIKSDRYNSSHRYTATVQSITPDGCEDVYDVTVENGHSVIFNGIATGQCSEVLQASTPSVYNEDGSFAEVGRDISCNLGSFNIQKVMESPSFEESTRRAIRQLTAVSDLSSVQSSPTVVKGNAKSHAVGLGAMNLHGFFAKNHMMYADDDSVCFTDLFFRSMYYYAVKASCEIARERGVKFDGFSESKYADGSAFDLYVENEPVVTDKVREVLSQYPGFVVPSVSDWVQLREDVKKYGIYNAYLLAVAPTGSISYVTGSTSSIHPIVNAIETRKEGKTGTVYVPAPYLSDDTLPYYKTAYNMPMEEMLKIYEAATPHIDQGISTTLFIRDINANSRFMTKIYIDAWKKGLKTLYYLRVKNSATEGTENGLAGSANNFCESCSI